LNLYRTELFKKVLLNLNLNDPGFDAAFGCPEGCMRIMPATYGHMINSLMALSYGRVAVVMEGGYFVPTVAEGIAMCLR
jgi:acetoin utilization deacetylase AcuC-like enzyme